MSIQFQINSTKTAKKLRLSGLCTIAIIAIMGANSAQAGSRSFNDDRGFFLFDLFGSAQNSKYRKPSPQVRGFKRSVGGYSYRFSDTLDGYGSKPRDFGPIFETGIFSDRLGVDGPYIGD